MAYNSYIRHKTIVSAPIDIVHSLDGDGKGAVPADWVHIAGPVGQTVTVVDMSGVATVLTSTASVSVFRGPFRKINASDSAINFGTGTPPGGGSRGADAAGGIQATTAADGAANTAIAETTVGSVLGAGQIDPFIHPHVAVTADDTNFATLTFKLYRANVVVKTWTMITNLALGNLAAGVIVPKGDPFACAKGDFLTVTQAKSGTGVQLPLRTVGGTVQPA